ncbi:MAG: VanZ family protein [Planctomycetes bacterium]|nr:VanZ family protein [Planctomycetota bacterium]
MALSRRQKATVISLLFYWPGIFIATHIPNVPRWVGQVGLSDKILHYLVYLVLTFLLWFAISPHKKVDWRRATVWWVVLVVVWYGVLDEVLQGYVGRQPDVGDFFADLGGALTGLILLTIFHFWPAGITITGGIIFALINFTRTNPADVLPVTNITFYFLAYGFFCMMWFRYMHHLLPLRAPQFKWLLGVLALPIGLLVTAETFSVFAGRSLEPARAIASATGIIAVVAIISLIALFRRND